MRIDRNLMTPSLRGVGDDVRRAEEDGYDAVWSGEASNDPFLPLAIAAEHASRLQLGTGITVAFARSPMTVASAAWDLQRFSEGRLILGLGSQVRAHIERRYSMPWSRPAARMRDFVLALRAIWDSWQTGEPLRYEGAFYRHTLLPPFFRPRPLRVAVPQVVVAAVGPAMTRAATNVADGVLLHAFTTERYLKSVSIPLIDAGLLAAGKPRDGFDVVLPCMVVTGTTDEEMKAAAAAVRAQIAFYASTPAYAPVLDLHGWGDLHLELRKLVADGRWTEISGLIDDEILDAFAVMAEPATVLEKIDARFGGVVDRLNLYTPYRVGDDLRAALRSQLATA
jgi:probable F420-dependent oxidoreductase